MNRKERRSSAARTEASCGDGMNCGGGKGNLRAAFLPSRLELKGWENGAISRDGHRCKGDQ